MGSNWRERLLDWGATLIAAFIITALVRWFLLGDLIEFFEARLGSRKMARDLTTLLLGALLFGYFVLRLHYSRESSQTDSNKLGAAHSNDQVRVRQGKGALFLDAASVCDQAFIAISKVQQVKCIEINVQAVNGDARIELHVQIESSTLLQQKHAELLAALQEMAGRLHIRLSEPPIIYAKLPPLLGGRTVRNASDKPSFSSLFRRDNTPQQRPSIFGKRFDESSFAPPPSTLDGEAPPRSSGSIFGSLRRPPKPDESDDEQPSRPADV